VRDQTFNPVTAPDRAGKHFHFQLPTFSFQLSTFSFPVLSIIHEDADLLVINKPAGLVCHPTKDGPLSSLIGRLRLYVGGDAWLINRLDRETSGVTVAAKSAEVSGELGKLWEQRAVQKEYRAIVHGFVAHDAGVIELPLGKDEKSQIAIKDCVRNDGATARTNFYVERHFSRPTNAGRASLPTSPDARTQIEPPMSFEKFQIPNSKLQEDFSARTGHYSRPFTLLRVVPHTGRKHQIRIHLAAIGHPVVGDKLYGGDEDLYLAFVQRRLTEEQQSRLILENHALHAQSLAFAWRDAPRLYTAPPDTAFAAFAQI
jgi:23S rRNA pseudouridine1911/1915/1917 synthase